jgi:hypothetical protein
MKTNNTQIREGHLRQKLKFNTKMGMNHKGSKYNAGCVQVTRRHDDGITMRKTKNMPWHK